MELVIPSHCSHHHFYQLLPFTSLAPCFHTLSFRIVFGLLFLKTYPCRAVLAPVEKTRFPFTFFFLHQTKHAIILRKQLTSARITLKPGLRGKWCYCAPCSPVGENTFLCSCRECNSLKFVFWYVNIDPSHFPNLAILRHWRHTIHKLCTTDFFFCSHKMCDEDKDRDGGRVLQIWISMLTTAQTKLHNYEVSLSECCRHFKSATRELTAWATAAQTRILISCQVLGKFG